MREVTVDSFWVVPSAFLLGAAGLAYGLSWLDEAVTAPVWWVGTAEAAASVLSTIAASMLTFLGVVFSITLVALQLASQQFSPRITRTFVRSMTTKVAFGLFAATFVTALVSLGRVEQGESRPAGPVASVTVSLALVGASLVVFIIFVTSITKLIRIAHLVAAVAEETRDAIEAAYPPGDDYILVPAPVLYPRTTQIRVGRTGRRTKQRSRGVLLGIDTAALVRLASEHDCVIVFNAKIGEYVGRGIVLAELHGENVPTEDQIRRAVQFGRERTLYQDPAYGIRELVDIGSQALSPAVNAPTTAVQVIDRLTDVLLRLGSVPDRAGAYTDADAVVRVLVPVASWDDIVALVYTELRTFGAGSPQVTRRLAASIRHLLEHLPAERGAALEEQLTLLASAVRDRWPDDAHRSYALQPDTLGLG
jgi:uncharacterized membrane protein